DPPTPDPKPRRLCPAAPPVASIRHHRASHHSPDQRRLYSLHRARPYHERHVFALHPSRHHRKPAELGGAETLTDPGAARPGGRDLPRARAFCDPNVSFVDPRGKPRQFVQGESRFRNPIAEQIVDPLEPPDRAATHHHRGLAISEDAAGWRRNAEGDTGPV